LNRVKVINMTRMGRPPKPVEQKKRTGNPGKRPLPKADVVALPVAASTLPEPHRMLGKAGSELWQRVWSSCWAWLKPTTDAETVLLVCESVDERQQLRHKVLSDPHAWRERKALRELEKQIYSALGDLGMNPVDRSRIGLSEVKESEFVKLNQKIAQRRNAASS
jgi:hypothetical protein